MPTEIRFTGDLSASKVSDPIAIPEGVKSIDIDIGWPATGTPVGAITIEESIHGHPSGDWQTYSRDGTNNLSVAVAGTADVAHIRDVEIRGPKTMRVRYTRTSGGTGATFNDGSPNAENHPLLTYSA